MQSSDVPPSGDAVFFYFPWLYSIWGECAWFQYSRFRQNCKYFFGAAAVPPIRIKTASLQNKFTSLQTPPLHLRQPHSDSDKPAPPPSMSGSVTLFLQFFPRYYYEIMKHHIMMRRDETFHGRASLPARCSTYDIADSPLDFFNTFVVIWRSFSTFVDKK